MPEARPLTGNLLVRLIPCFFSALLFMSGLLAVFAPLPILDASFRFGRGWAWFAAGVNTALIAWLGGLPSVAIFSVFVLALGLGLPEALKAGMSPARAVILTLCLMAATLLAWISADALMRGVAPWVAAKIEVNRLLDQLVQGIPAESRSQWLGELTVEEWKHGLLVEFPSALAVAMILICWANLMMLIRLDPGAMNTRLNSGKGWGWDYFKSWRAPDLLLWPTIAAGGTVIFFSGPVSAIALNFFKVFMTIYALQGLSVLANLFDLWKVRGFWRFLGYFVVVLLMMPLLLAIGFFDTWFDFRSKLRQS